MVVIIIISQSGTGKYPQPQEYLLLNIFLYRRFADRLAPALYNTGHRFLQRQLIDHCVLIIEEKQRIAQHLRINNDNQTR